MVGIGRVNDVLIVDDFLESGTDVVTVAILNVNYVFPSANMSAYVIFQSTLSPRSVFGFLQCFHKSSLELRLAIVDVTDERDVALCPALYVGSQTPNRSLLGHNTASFPIFFLEACNILL